MNRLSAPLGLLFAMVALVSGCGAAAEPPVPEEQRRYVAQLATMMFGDKDEVEVNVGYRLARLALLDQVDRERSVPSDFGKEAFHRVFAPLDPLYRTPENESELLFQVGTQAPDETSARVARERRNFSHQVREADEEEIRANATAVAILTYENPGSDRPQRLAGALQFGGPAVTIPISQGCRLFVSKNERGYIKSVVATLLLPAGGELHLGNAEAFDCIFAAQIYSAGLQDAVVSGRFRGFPRYDSDLTGCLVTRAGHDRQPALSHCFSPISGTTRYAVLARMLSLGLLRPGRLDRDSFEEMAIRAIRDIGWDRIAVSDDLEKREPHREDANRGPIVTRE